MACGRRLELLALARLAAHVLQPLDDRSLHLLAAQLLQRAAPKCPACRIFDNSAAGYAMEDAARLQSLVDHTYNSTHTCD